MFRANFCACVGEGKFYKTVIVASSWCSIFTLPTLMMHGQTQIKFAKVCLYSCGMRFRNVEHDQGPRVLIIKK
jgi:hypothetical protein